VIVQIRQKDSKNKGDKRKVAFLYTEHMIQNLANPTVGFPDKWGFYSGNKGDQREQAPEGTGPLCKPHFFHKLL